MGKLWLVGAGPGDIDLITVKGLRSIQQADVILYDRLINEQLLAYAKPDAELIYCGKLPNNHAMPQDAINHSLVHYAKQGKQVVRLKGGDPFVFGRGGEEAAFAAKHHVSFEIIPGITSAISVAAFAGIPLTHRNFSSSVAFITGHTQTGQDDARKWQALALGIDTLAIYMGVSNIAYIVQQLITHGKDPQTPAAVIYAGTTKQQQTLTGTLESLPSLVKQLSNPSMIIIGAVVTLREQLQWFVEQSVLECEPV
ncbi:uroporphyrinogen-III C-methyltransferase [Paenibacillus yanchengensis]|uniref:uroporphyrinogen-III C-methyltransferase n=1 Tax=Paenibacillus yanchengensis TaxID=2035833 RepID=A0ABW4YNB5_9BACL